MVRTWTWIALAAVVAATAAAGCKKDDCETAREIYLEQARKRADLAVAGMTDPAAKAEAQKASDAELADATTKFVPACQELGAARVLACVNQALAQAEKPDLGLELTADCKALGNQLQAKLYARP